MLENSVITSNGTVSTTLVVENVYNVTFSKVGRISCVNMTF